MISRLQLRKAFSILGYLENLEKWGSVDPDIFYALSRRMQCTYRLILRMRLRRLGVRP